MSALAVDKTICQRRQHHCAAHGCVRECTGPAGRGKFVVSILGHLIVKQDGAAGDAGVVQVVFQSSTCLGGGKVKPDTDLRNWLDAQQTRRTAELALAQVRRSVLVNQTTLYKALGGSDRSQP